MQLLTTKDPCEVPRELWIFRHAEAIGPIARQGPAGNSYGANQLNRLLQAYGQVFRIAVALSRRLRLSGLLTRLTVGRLEPLLSQRLILRDLGTCIDWRIHRKRMAELLHVQYNRVALVDYNLRRRRGKAVSTSRAGVWSMR